MATNFARYFGEGVTVNEIKRKKKEKKYREPITQTHFSMV
jgi:hypothetical protein